MENYNFIEGGGITGNLIRNFDWEKTEIGPPSQWPQTLKHAVRIMLDSPVPTCITWGPAYIRLYNDNYIPSLGPVQHPQCLGVSVQRSSPVSWTEFEPLMKKVMSGEVISLKDLKTKFNKNGEWEDCYIDLTLIPLRLDNFEVGGILVQLNETTDKVRALHLLKKSEQRFRDLVMQAPVAIAVFRGPDYIVETANNAYLPLVGKTMDEMVGKPLFQVLPETEATLKPLADELVRTGKPFPATEFEIVLNRFGRSETCYFNSVWEPLREQDGTIDGFLAVVHEVTQQVMARKKVEESEQKYKNLVEEAVVPTAVFKGKNMVLELANKAMLQLWDKDKSIIGKPLLEFLPEIKAQNFEQLWMNVFETGEMYQVEDALVYLNKKGSLQPVYMDFSYKALRSLDNEITHLLVMASDVTDRVLFKKRLEKSEENLRNMILKSPVAMCILTGPQFVVEIANERMYELWGKPENELLNKPIFEGLSEAKDQGFESLLQKVYTTGETFSAQEVPINLPRNGELQTIYINFVYEAFKEGEEIKGVMAVAIEVTEQIETRRRIEEVVDKRTKELKQANAELQKSNAELEQFAYIASHDLQEPLRKVNTFTQMLEGSIEVTNQEAFRYFEKIKSSAARMSALVRDVLKYSQLSKADIHFEAIDLNATSKAILDDFELLIEQKKAAIIIDNLPVIEGIPLQISQLFANLISNALKFVRPDEKPVIHITGRPIEMHELPSFHGLDNGKEYYRFEIADNGIGIEEEHIDKIFNIFQRLHGKNEYQGTGIGLAICKKIVLNHNGYITASSNSQGGTSFIVVLPSKQTK